MKQKTSTVVNKARRFVNKTKFDFVDKTQERVNNVNKVVNKTKGGLLTPKCKSNKCLSPLSTMSTKKSLKMYTDRRNGIYVHNSRPIRARVRISRIRVFKKLC